MRVNPLQQLEDRYARSAEVAGEGLNGEVRIVTDRATKCRRVLKTLQLADSEEEGELDGVMNEMQVYLQLDHPNICRLLEVFLDDSACHLIMELCTGKDLCARWEARGCFSEKDACSALGQMMDAVRYLHVNQVCHRDLKLENWVYADPSENARLKLIDFGLSEVFSHDAPMTAILGTIFYVAPEVLGQFYDFKCDVWSLGVIAYMLLCGMPPFGAFEDADEDIVDLILDGSDVDLSGGAWAGVSDCGRDFVAQLLTRDPEGRPTAQEASMHPWLDGRAACQHSGAAEISVGVLESLRSFASMNAIKRAACSLIANSMSVAETDELQAQFKRLDTRQNGTILVQDLVEVLKEKLGMSDAEAMELSGNLNPNQDQRLHYSDFLAAVTQRRILASEAQIRKAFQRFDLDNSGAISLENLREVLGNEFEGVTVEEIMNQADVSGDGVIRYEEFLRAMMDLGSSGGDAPAGRDNIKNISRAWEFTTLGRFAPKQQGPKRKMRRGATRAIFARKMTFQQPLRFEAETGVWKNSRECNSTKSWCLGTNDVFRSQSHECDFAEHYAMTRVASLEGIPAVPRCFSEAMAVEEQLSPTLLKPEKRKLPAVQLGTRFVDELRRVSALPHRASLSAPTELPQAVEVAHGGKAPRRKIPLCEKE